MLKFSVEDFVEEVTAEIACYEELGEEKAHEWRQTFLKLADEGRIDKRALKLENGVVSVRDEEDIFVLADSFLAAVTDGEEQKYWAGLQKF